MDWYSKQIHVKRSLYRQQFQKPKTKSAIRDIDLTDRLARELYVWKLVCPTNDNNLVFPSPQGKMTQHDNVVKRYFNSALRSAGLKQVSFHSLRHSNASFRIHVGQNVKYIQNSWAMQALM
ncbi:Phage integrase (fragment) [Candidatus Sulfobium mesophilum]|uniref:Phage integrase n=1 Tax=Candidatus Sulfobium mesophilum TaxID=2016548 RepID=A0A2U3QIE9_9BACT